MTVRTIGEGVEGEQKKRVRVWGTGAEPWNSGVQLMIKRLAEHALCHVHRTWPGRQGGVFKGLGLLLRPEKRN